jgi:glutaconate CoA-transferase subunit B
MIVSGAREINDGDVVYTGTGWPTVAFWLAKLTHAPNAILWHEQGVMRDVPCPEGDILDSQVVHHRATVMGRALVLNGIAANGHIHKGYLGAGQVDRYGNVNSTVIGDYLHPTYRFPGSGGANEVISFCRQTVIILAQKRQRFPEKVDFITSPGYLDGEPNQREKIGLPPGTGPSAVVTDLGVYHFVNGEMILSSYHGDLGVTIDDVRREVGWDIKAVANVAVTEPPNEDYLRLLREVVDPKATFREGKRKR